MTHDDILHLSQLARITLPEDQLQNFKGDFDQILEHISAINTISSQESPLPQYHHQTLREDAIKDPHPTFPSDVKERLYAAMPETEGTALVVKTVLTN